MQFPRLNSVYALGVASLLVVAALVGWLWYTQHARGPKSPELVVYCAAAAREPFEKAVAAYEKEYDVVIRPQYGGSASLLSQLEVSKNGDLLLAGDVSLLEIGRQKGLVAEGLPLVWLEPVLAVRKGNPKGIQSIEHLTRAGMRIGMGDPERAEIGRITKRVLTSTGQWGLFEKQVTQRGVVKPTEPDLVIDLRAESIDAAVIWNSSAQRHADLEIVPVSAFRRARSLMSVGVATCAKDPTSALHFARYLAAADRGLGVFKAAGFDPVEGDRWADRPELTFFAGSVNRRALAPIIERFEKREGIKITTVFNACGVLTATMHTVDKADGKGFPDIYVACDVYYLDVVKDWFEPGINISNTDIVMVVPKGNPGKIAKLEDLAAPGVRVAIGETGKVTIGVLTKRLLESAGLFQKLVDSDNIKVYMTSSAFLVPQVTTKAADVALAYRSDTLAEANRVDVIPIDSPLAKAVQPFTIAKRSAHKQLARRLLDEINKSKADYAAAGLNFEEREK